MTPSGKIGDEGSDDSALKGPEKAKEDAQDSGGGFEHLVEDALNSQIVADWDINVGEMRGILFGDEVDLRYWNDGNPYLVTACDTYFGFYAANSTDLSGTYAGFNNDGTLDLQAAVGYLHLAAASNGVFEISLGTDPGASALRLHAPDDSKWDIKVSNAGVLSAVAV